MKNKRKNQGTSLPCDELRPDDGIDPKILFRREERGQKHLRKDRQLCKQAFQLLSLVLEKYTLTDWGKGMYLAQVLPAPDGTRLKIIIGFYFSRTFEETLIALSQLRSLTKVFRWELGSIVSRKNVPELIFDIAPPEVGHDNT